MSEEATVGLMIWDGKSAGTLLNVLRLLGLGKKVVLYVVPDRRFVELRSVADGRDLVARCDPMLRRKVEERAHLEATAKYRSLEPSLFR
jgi:adenine-specific DNA-methyltransferase